MVKSEVSWRSSGKRNDPREKVRIGQPWRDNESIGQAEKLTGRQLHPLSRWRTTKTLSIKIGTMSPENTGSRPVSKFHEYSMSPNLLHSYAVAV